MTLGTDGAARAHTAGRARAFGGYTWNSAQRASALAGALSLGDGSKEGAMDCDCPVSGSWQEANRRDGPPKRVRKVGQDLAYA